MLRFYSFLSPFHSSKFSVSDYISFPLLHNRELNNAEIKIKKQFKDFLNDKFTLNVYKVLLLTNNRQHFFCHFAQWL